MLRVFTSKLLGEYSTPTISNSLGSGTSEVTDLAVIFVIGVQAHCYMASTISGIPLASLDYWIPQMSALCCREADGEWPKVAVQRPTIRSEPASRRDNPKFGRPPAQIDPEATVANGSLSR
jgi:hypothetical protein